MKTKFKCVAKVYGLTDHSGDVFYVGCTVKELIDRLGGHLSEAKINDVWMNQIKNAKIRSLEYNIGIRELDKMKVTGKTRYEAQRKAATLERRWIQRFLDAGFELVNRVHARSDYSRGSKKRLT